MEFFDWTSICPQSAVVACEFYDAMLDEADEFGLWPSLLTLPASPTSVAVRRWFLSEMIGQLHGKAPVAWVDSRYHAAPADREAVRARPSELRPVSGALGSRPAIALRSTLP